MPKRNRKKSDLDRDANAPQWYWKRGLHDACITQVERFDFPYDYGEYTGTKNKNDRNLLRMKIDAEGALFDREVTEIRLFNYEIVTPHIHLEGREAVWWLSDSLTACDKGYLLEIDLQDLHGDPSDFVFKIKFERAEVDRNNDWERQ